MAYTEEELQEIIEHLESLNIDPEVMHAIASHGPAHFGVEPENNMDKMLFEVSSFYEQEIDYDIKQLTDKIEPLLILIVGVVVLMLALGIFLPMWNMVYIVH